MKEDTLVVTLHAGQPEPLDETHVVVPWRLEDGPEHLLMVVVDEDGQ